MNRIIMAALLSFGAYLTTAQTLVINELDCDTPGIDDKEFVELRSETPHFPLDGYVLAFFNGSAAGANSSYMVFDLAGYTTDINGLLLIGSATVVPSPQYLIAPNLIQNGADALAIYQRSVEDFPEGTLAFVDQTLIDVLIYGTNDADATGLISIFQAFRPGIQQANEGPGNNTASIQRNNNGTYFSGPPTPRRLNDGSGIVLNGVLTSLPQTQYDEGAEIPFTFSLEQAVAQDITILFSLSNGTFGPADFSGDTSVVIPAGQLSATTTITILDDADDEGDEVAVFRLAPLPAEFLILNNNRPIRIVDNDFRVAPFGTPLQPTVGIVTGTQPENYYETLNGLSGPELRQALQNIIANPSVVRAQTYADLVDMLKEADQNPLNSNQVWLVYTERGRSKIDFQTTSANTGVWNREHAFPRSRGGFGSISLDSLADGRDIFWPTNADSLRHANSDAHAIRAEDAAENSNRGNRFYGQYSGPAGNMGSFKGDMARSVLYIAVRYNGLDVVPGYPEGMVGLFGHLDTLLQWHRNDPPDDYEMNRNNVVYSWQFNRNPFIDQPELVEYLWGNNLGQAWQNQLTTNILNDPRLSVFPNPTKGAVHIRGISEPAQVEVFNAQGRRVAMRRISSDDALTLDSGPGWYVVKVYMAGRNSVYKVLAH
ncbi:MAG: endonuclease [Saprospiraceae bacterium]|nr:endonuclease [Saprospiraceae bacterium]